MSDSVRGTSTDPDVSAVLNLAILGVTRYLPLLGDDELRGLTWKALSSDAAAVLKLLIPSTTTNLRDGKDAATR